MNDQSDNYSYANDMVGRAVQNFDSIDRGGSGRLNLIDIMAYEKTGPQQKQIGLVLEHNYDTLKGLDADQKAHDYIDLGDLQKAQLLGGGDMQAIDKEKNNRAMDAAKAAAVVAGTVFGAGIVGGAVLFGPETLIISAPVAAVATGAGAAVAYQAEMHVQETMQAKAQGLRP